MTQNKILKSFGFLNKYDRCHIVTEINVINILYSSRSKCSDRKCNNVINVNYNYVYISYDELHSVLIFYIT